MPKRDKTTIDQMITLEANRPPAIPLEWVEVIEKLHPITAVIVWSVLNDQVSAETISLARYSPDVHRYASIATIAGGDPLAIASITQQAYEELFELFADLLNHPRTAHLH